MSFHPYNDTVASEYYPVHSVVSGGQERIINPQGQGRVTVEDAEAFVSPALLDLGGEEKIPILRRNRTEEVNIPTGIHTLTSTNLPDDIAELGREITKQAIVDETSGRPYRVVGPEYVLYEALGVPLPRKHHDVRHLERMERRPGRSMYLRTCDRSGEQVVSVYPQESPFQVVSQEVYEKEVYG